MKWSEPIGVPELVVLGAPAPLTGDVDGEGRWSPPRWNGNRVQAAPLPAVDPQEAAFARGFVAGRVDAERRVEADVRPVVAALQRAAERFADAEAMFERDRGQWVLVLALAVARHLFQREVQVDPDLVSNLVQKAIEQVPHDAAIEIRLHPDDLEAARVAGGGSAAFDSGARVDWVSDPAMSRGDCLVECGSRVVDGRLDVVVRQIGERLGHV